MKMKIFSSVKTKLSLWFVGTLALIITIFSIALYIGLSKSLMNGIDSSLEAMARKRHIDILEGLERTGFQHVHEEDIKDIEELDDVKNIYTLTYIQLLELPGR